MTRPPPALTFPPDEDRCEAVVVTYQATGGDADAAPVTARCSRVWLVRVSGTKLCRSCSVAAETTKP
jgi:hypothetical protein